MNFEDRVSGYTLLIPVQWILMLDLLRLGFLNGDTVDGDSQFCLWSFWPLCFLDLLIELELSDALFHHIDTFGLIHLSWAKKLEYKISLISDGSIRQTHLDKVCDVSRCEALGWVQPVLVFVLFGLFSIFTSWQHVVLVVLGPLQQAGVLHFTHLQYLVGCPFGALTKARLGDNRVDLKHL